MTDLAVVSLLVLLLGPCVGSFVALCADRIPAGRDVVRQRSTCDTCDAALGLPDLVPILSFATLRGRCRTCKAAIPAHLLYLEIVAAGVAIWAVLAGGDASQVLLNACLLWLLLALGAIDWTSYRLPDPFTALLAIVALLRAPDLQLALMGGAIGSGAFLVLRWAYRAVRGRDGLGLGDVKLMFGLGAAVGPVLLPVLVLIAAATALAGALVARLRKGQARFDQPLPFGAALCAAAGVLWLAGAY